jgi:transcriptional regulator with XRE-family HTH domain
MNTTLNWMSSVNKKLPYIAVQLKKIREKAGISQQELAFQTGLSMSLIAQIEQGKKLDPRMSTVQALANALGVEYTELMEAQQGEKKPSRTRKK